MKYIVSDSGTSYTIMEQRNLDSDQEVYVAIATCSNADIAKMIAGALNQLDRVVS